MAAQSYVYKEYSWGLRTQPCGAPVLRMIVEEVLLSILTDCGLWVRKFRIQSQRNVVRPRPQSLEMSLVGIMVLKAKLLSYTLTSNEQRLSLLMLEYSAITLLVMRGK